MKSKETKNLIEKKEIESIENESKPDKNDSDYIDLLTLLNEQPESMNFLLKLTPEEIQNLEKLAIEKDNSVIYVKILFV